MSPDILLTATHAAVTVFMAGVIWFVQVVHYPLFGTVPHASFAVYHAGHTRLTSRVVLPPMLLELGAAVLLLLRPPPGMAVAALAGLTLGVVIWLSTFLLQVPQHGVLAAGYDARAHRRLVRTNWIRTAGWSARAVLALWLLAAAGS